LTLWKNACAALQAAEHVIVWGYSLPPTDIKAQQLFSITLERRDLKLCVIDPSPLPGDVGESSSKKNSFGSIHL
jgi:hypothetical protein